MSVSRKQPGVDANTDLDESLSIPDYLAEKRELQDRSGYPAVSDERVASVAVDEKLPMGSQSY